MKFSEETTFSKPLKRSSMEMSAVIYTAREREKALEDTGGQGFGAEDAIVGDANRCTQCHSTGQEVLFFFFFFLQTVNLLAKEEDTTWSHGHRSGKTDVPESGTHRRARSLSGIISTNQNSSHDEGHPTYRCSDFPLGGCHRVPARSLSLTTTISRRISIRPAL